MGNFAGAIVGAFAFESVLHVFKDLPQVGGVNLGKHWQLWMGTFIVLVVLFAPRGLLGLSEKILTQRGSHPLPPGEGGGEGPASAGAGHE